MAVRVFPSIVATVLLGSASLAQAQEAWVKGVWDTNKEAVARLKVWGRKAGGGTSECFGTGFFFHRDGFLLTAAHVIDPHCKKGQGEWLTAADSSIDRRILVTTESRSSQQRTTNDSSNVIVIYVDSQLDLALLRVKGLYPDGAYPYVKLGNSFLVNPTDSILGGIWSDRPSPVGRPGVVDILFDPSAAGLLRMNLDAENGDSGSPIFNKDGYVVGILARGKDGGDRPTFARPINFAVNMVNYTVRAAALDEAVSLLAELERDPIARLAPLSKQFGEVGKSLDALEKLADALKRGTRVSAGVRFLKDPDPRSQTENVNVVVQIGRDFPMQRVPDQVTIKTFPAWEFHLSDDDKKREKELTTRLSIEDARGQKIWHEKTVDRAMIERVGREKPGSLNYSLPINLDEWARAEGQKWLKQRFEERYGAATKEKLSATTLSSMRIVEMEVEIKWSFVGEDSDAAHVWTERLPVPR